MADVESAVPHRVEMWKTVRRVITLAAVIAAVYFLIVVPFGRTITGTRASMERNLEKVLGAITKTDTHTIEGRAEITESKEISELSLLEMRMSATRTIERSERFSGLPLGTKKLIVRGHFRVKGGYKLQPGTSLRLDGDVPVARFPKPEVLSVEMLDFDVLSEESGWLNRVQAPDREQILRELREQMRNEAEHSGMLETVEATLRTRLRDLMGVDAVSVEQKMP